MNNRSWMNPENSAKEWKQRSNGRRKQDGRPRMETLLGAVVVVAWGWGIYELTLLFLH